MKKLSIALGMLFCTPFKMALFIALSLGVVSCDESEPQPEFEQMKRVEVKIKLIDSSWKTEFYEIPVGDKLCLETSKGSYWLGHKSSDQVWSNELRVGVIDFEIVSVDTLPKPVMPKRTKPFVP